ncbi:hypothetical protein [Pseudoduganella sp. OTU4001]
MGREDIGAYLGLTVESVSRQLAGPRPYSAPSTLYHHGG